MLRQTSDIHNTFDEEPVISDEIHLYEYIRTTKLDPKADEKLLLENQEPAYHIIDPISGNVVPMSARS